jgi:hypothetical protein
MLKDGDLVEFKNEDTVPAAILIHFNHHFERTYDVRLGDTIEQLENTFGMYMTLVTPKDGYGNVYAVNNTHLKWTYITLPNRHIAYFLFQNADDAIMAQLMI